MTSFMMSSMTIMANAWQLAQVTKSCAFGNAVLTYPNNLNIMPIRRETLGSAHISWANTKEPFGGWDGLTPSSVRFLPHAEMISRFASGRRKSPQKNRRQLLSNRRMESQTRERALLFVGSHS